MANKKAKGKRAKTRSKLKRRYRPLTISRLFADFDIGQRVQVVIDSAVHSGMPSRRFHGLVGTVVKKQGKVFCVSLKNGNKELELFVHPAHLRALGTAKIEQAKPVMEKVAV